MTRIPAHVTKQIETRLGAPIRYAAGTFHPDKCPRCRAWTLHGLNNTMTRLDPTPLSADLEQAALILGRWTYQLHHTPGHYQITTRATPQRPIWTNPPPPGDNCIVIPTHVCNKPPLAPAIPITRNKNTNRITDKTPIPF